MSTLHEDAQTAEQPVGRIPISDDTLVLIAAENAALQTRVARLTDELTTLQRERSIERMTIAEKRLNDRLFTLMDGMLPLLKEVREELFGRRDAVQKHVDRIANHVQPLPSREEFDALAARVDVLLTQGTT